jgi:hypothetical protein
MGKKDNNKTGNLDLFNELANGSVKDTEAVVNPVRDVVEQTTMDERLRSEWLSINNDALFSEVTSWQIF